MDRFSPQSQQKDKIGRLIKLGLIRELFQRGQITRTQFEQLMSRQRV